MPTYEYQCVKCKHRFEEFHGMSERPKLKCPKCKGRVERLISGGAGLLFKGSGFYITDYRSESYRQAARSDASSSTSSSSTSTPKSDTPKSSGKASKATS